MVNNVIGLYDCPEVDAQLDGRPSASLPHRIWQSAGVQPSIEQAELQRITGRATWPTTNAQGLQLVSLALGLLQAAHREADWSWAANAWKSLILLEGILVERKADSEFFVILGSSQFGCIAWPCEVVALHGRRFARPITAEKTVSAHVFVFDLDAWRCWPCKVLSPCEMSAMGMRLPGVGAALGPKRRTLVQGAAVKGFRGVAQTWVEKLAAVVGISFGGERMDFLTKLETLLKHIFPTEDDEAIHSYLHSRSPKAFDSWLHTQSNLDHIDQVLDSFDKAMCRGEKHNKDTNENNRGQAKEFSKKKVFVREGSKTLEFNMDEGERPANKKNKEAGDRGATTQPGGRPHTVVVIRHGAEDASHTGRRPVLLPALPAPSKVPYLLSETGLPPKPFEDLVVGRFGGEGDRRVVDLLEMGMGVPQGDDRAAMPA